MIMSEICPLCGGGTILKEVTEVIRGGNHTAIVKVQAEVCTRCGERLYTPEFVKHCEDIKTKLENNETEEFKPLGISFRAK